MFDFLRTKSAIAEAAEAFSKMNTAIDVAEAELARQRLLPLPQYDYADFLCERVDAKADHWRTQLQLATKTSREKYSQLSDVFMLENNGAYAVANQVQPINIYGLFRTPIKEALHAEIMAWPWPADVGLPRAKRATLIEKLTKEIADLKAKRSEILAQAKEAGLDLTQQSGAHAAAHGKTQQKAS